MKRKYLLSGVILSSFIIFHGGIMNPEGILIFAIFGVLVLAAIFTPRITKLLGIQEKKSSGE
jgi:hypothetical protein